MWSPDGYVSWVEVTSELWDRGVSILHRAVILEKPELAEKISFVLPSDLESLLVRSGLSKTQQEAKLTVAISMAWLTANFLLFFPPVAVSLTGGKVALSGIFFEHMHQLDRHSFSWPLNTAPPYSKYFEHQKKNGFTAADISSGFAFLDLEWGSLKVKNGTRDFLTRIADLRESEADDAIALARKLEDFVLCWPDKLEAATYRWFFETMEGAPFITQAINELFGPPDMTEHSRGKATLGRPRGRDEVVLQIELMYPDGTSGIPHKQIFRRVLDAGIKVSDRTITRAIREVRMKCPPK